MTRADITIYGAGIFGLATAYACTKLGAKVQVIDPYGIGAGSSGGVLGALAPHVPEQWEDKKQFQFESLDGASAFWGDVEALSGRPTGYIRAGRVLPLWDEHNVALAQTRVGQAHELWQGRYEWRVETSAEYGGWALDRAPQAWVFDGFSAHIHPRKAVNALASAVRAQGGTVVPEGQPEGRIVWATGWRGLDATMGNGEKGQAALLDVDLRGRPQLFVDAIHVIPHEDGTVAVGSTSERYFDDPTSTDALLDTVVEKIKSRVPDLRDANVIERWAGVRPRAITRAPILGQHPTRGGEFIANGGFKIGFGMAPKVGEVMAALVVNDVDTIPDDFRAPNSV